MSSPEITMTFFNTDSLDFYTNPTKDLGELGRLKKFQQSHLGQLGGFYSSEEKQILAWNDAI
jgi:hypothetical protein